MSTNSATPPATRRIAKSYLTDLVVAAANPPAPVRGAVLVTAVVEQLIGRAVQVRHVLRSDQLVLTFDLADDPAGWATPEPAAAEQGTAAGTGGSTGFGRLENADYPGQPGDRADQVEQQRQEQLR